MYMSPDMACNIAFAYHVRRLTSDQMSEFRAALEEDETEKKEEVATVGPAMAKEMAETFRVVEG